MPTAAIFDLDSTLLDSVDLHALAWQEAFLEFGLGWDWTPDLYTELLAVSGGVDRIASYIDSLGLPAAEKIRLRRLVPGIHRVKTSNYGELLASHAARLRPGVARLIEEAHRAGLRVGLCDWERCWGWRRPGDLGDS